MPTQSPTQDPTTHREPPSISDAKSQRAASSKRGFFKSQIRKLALRLGLFPHITLNNMPFKTFEFYELMRNCGITKNDRLLDLGCGAGTQTLIVGRLCREIVGVDVDPKAVELATIHANRLSDVADAQFLCGPIETLGLAANSFDKILSFCVIEHIPNADVVLAELHRVLKPGGKLILSADSLGGIEDSALIEKHKTENHVHQYFNHKSLNTALTEAGFEVDELYPIFRSEHARISFEKGIRTGFSYSFWQALRAYFKLKREEARCQQYDKGLFLIARCHKLPANTPV